MQNLSEPEYQTFRERLARLQSFIARSEPDLEEICKTWLEKSRISISRPNQFPGYRSVVLFNPMFFDHIAYRYHDSNIIALVAVTSDGRLNSHEFHPAIKGNSFHLSIDEALKLLETDQDKWIVREKNVDMILSGPGSGINEWLQNHKNDLAEAISPFKSVPRKGIIAYLGKLTGQDFKQARLALRNALDPDVVKTMHGTGLASIKGINWLTGGDGVPPEIIFARKQAVRAYPILARQFIDVYSTTLRDAIDARASLSDAIAAYFNLDKDGQQHKVKRLQGLTWQRADADPYKTEHRIWEILKLPERTVPKTRKQFKQLEIFKSFGHFVFDENLRQTMERLSREGNPWDIIERIEQTSGRNVDDAVDFLAMKLYIPAILNKIGRIADHHGITPPDRLTQDRSYPIKSSLIMMTMAKKAIHSSFKVRELLDWSDRYHRNIARYEDRLVTIDLEQDWPGISGTIKCNHGHVARELTSAKALRIQGRMENHCIGGYLPSVLKGENNRSKEIILIFSIEKNGKILSTAEIGCIRESCHSIDSETGRKTKTFQIKARVIENLAHSNNEPSMDAIRIAKQVIKQLEQIKPNAWKSYLDGLEHSKAEQGWISGIDAHIRNCGFDPFDRAMMERVWAELKPALPRSLRKEKLDGFIDQSPANRQLWHLKLGSEQVEFRDPDKIDDDGRKITQKIARECTEEENFCP